MGSLCCSIGLYVCFFVCLFCFTNIICLDYCSFIILSEVLRVMPSAWYLFLRIALVILGLLCFHIIFFFVFLSFQGHTCSIWRFHINFWIVCSRSVKNAMGHLIGIALNLQIVSGSMAILMILLFPIQEHRISLHFFESLIFLINILQFSEYKSFTSLFRFSPRDLIFWCNLISTYAFLIVFLIVQSGCHAESTGF